MTIVMDDQPAKTRKCGIVMPISASGTYTEAHWKDVLGIFKESFQSTEFAVELVSNADDIGVIQKRIVQNLYTCDLVVCDVSGKNANVMFELGMRLAFDKPAIIVKDDETTYSFDTSPIEHLTYPRSLHYQSIQAFKAKLLEKSLATYVASQQPGYTTFLKHFGEFVVAKIEAKPVSKEDFILQELGELRKAVAEVGRATKPIYAESSPGSMRARAAMLELERLVRDYLDKKDLRPEDVLPLGSDALNELIGVYASNKGMPQPLPGSPMWRDLEVTLSNAIRRLGTPS